ncbi:MAG: ribokinase [Firmicutes bacterium]|nr:ribokinase [Bacillota bacterium]
MKIGIVGSINIDFVTVVDRAPKQGETVVGESFRTVMGGKGANLAVAIGRLGGDVTMFGAVGDDDFGKKAVNNLQDNNVQVDNIKTLENESSGIATITVMDGNNSIIVIGGANTKVDENFVKAFENKLKECDIIGTQLEICPSAVLWLSRFAKKNNIKFVFNPSPDKEYNFEIIKNADIVIVNEIEIQKFGGKKLLSNYVNKLILTEGREGASFHNGVEIIRVSTPKVDVVDTTGAGDTFMGALIVEIGDGKSLEEAVRFATVAASIKCTKLGAQTAMPKRAEVEVVLK